MKKAHKRNRIFSFSCGKMKMMLRLTAALLMAFQLSLSANAFAQTKVSLNLKDATVSEFISALKDQTGTQFLYNASLMRNETRVSVESVEEDLFVLLDRVLPSFNLRYDIVNNIVVLKPARQKPAAGKEDENWVVIGKVVDKQKNPLPGVTIQLKGRTVGTATNGNGDFSMDVPKAVDTLVVSFIGMKTKEVVIKKADNKQYEIVLEEDVKALEEVNVVSTGYQDIDRRRLTSAITTIKMDDINVAGLSSVDKMLEGYVPGMIFMQNSGQAGAAPKLRIRGTSTVLGNQEPLWVVDGIVQTDPVNVDPSELNSLDFVNLLGNAISGLNPDDIEQIDVLKDAAATAIYGTRAANGVIVITTKKGKVGKPHVTYSFSGTVNRRPYYSDREVYLMNSKERVDVSRELFARGMEFTEVSNWVGYEAAYVDYKNGRIGFDEFQRLTDYYETVNTDWFDILCQNSFSNKHTLSLSGGSETIRYYASIGYGDEKGVIKKEYNRNYTANLKLNGNFKKMDFQFSLQANNNKRKYTPNTSLSSGGETSITEYAYNMSRAIPAYDEEGNRWFYQRGRKKELSYPFNMENEMDKTYQTINTYSVTLPGTLKYRLLSCLNLEGTASYTIGSTNDETVFEDGSYYIHTLRQNDIATPGEDSNASHSSNKCPFGGELRLSDTRRNNYTLRLQANYNQLFADKHLLNIALGGEVSSNEYHGYQNTTRGYYPERGKSFGTILIGDLFRKYNGYGQWVALNKPRITDTKTNLASAYLAVTYTYDDRYTFNFNTRMDGSNQFGSRANEKLLPIWSVSGRWDIKRDFFEDSNFVNDLALKLSYGIQGNMLDNQSTRMIINKGDLDSWYGEFESTIDTYPNPDLQWETTHSYNAELTFSLWRNKIGGTIGYYYKHTKDAFLTKKVSDINGVTSYVVNRGELSNQGLELTLNIEPVNQTVDASGKRGFVWRIDPQLGQVVNSLISKAIDDRSNTIRDEITYTDYLTGNVELVDRPLNTFFSYRFKGLSSKDGSPMYAGLEEENADALYEQFSQLEDEEVFELVMEESGTRVPTLQGGVSSYLGYRQFGLSFNFTYSFGNKVRLLKLFGNNAMDIPPSGEKNMRREFTRRWRTSGDELKTNIPGLRTGNELPWWNNTKYTSSGLMPTFAPIDVYAMYDNSSIRVAKGNYLKLQSLSFRYNVHDEFCKKIGIQSAYLSITGTNMFTITNKALKGQDVTQSGAAPTVNMSLRPNYSFTLNVTF